MYAYKVTYFGMNSDETIRDVSNLRLAGEWFEFADGHSVKARIRAAAVERIDRIDSVAT